MYQTLYGPKSFVLDTELGFELMCTAERYRAEGDVDSAKQYLSLAVKAEAGTLTIEERSTLPSAAQAA